MQRKATEVTCGVTPVTTWLAAKYSMFLLLNVTFPVRYVRQLHAQRKRIYFHA